MSRSSHDAEKAHAISAYMLDQFCLSLAQRTRGKFSPMRRTSVTISPELLLDCESVVNAMVTAFLNPCEYLGSVLARKLTSTSDNDMGLRSLL